MSAGGQHGEYMIGVFGAVATLIGLRRLVVTGGGGVLDLSGPRGRDDDAAVQPAHDGDPGRRRPGPGGTGRPSATWWRRRTATSGSPSSTGSSTGGTSARWSATPSGPTTARSTSVAARTERCDELNPVIEAWCAERTTAEIVELATLLRIPCIEVGNGESIPQMDHFAVRAVLRRQPGRRVPAAGTAVPDAPADPRCRRGASGAGRRPGDPHGAAPGAVAAPRRRCGAGSAAAGGAARRRLHVVLGGAVPRPRARDVRRRRHPRRVDRPARRGPADEPPPADRAAVVGAVAVLPRHEHEQARRHARPVARRRAATWPTASSPSATWSSRTTAHG